MGEGGDAERGDDPVVPAAHGGRNADDVRVQLAPADRVPALADRGQPPAQRVRVGEGGVGETGERPGEQLVEVAGGRPGQQDEGGGAGVHGQHLAAFVAQPQRVPGLLAFQADDGGPGAAGEERGVAGAADEVAHDGPGEAGEADALAGEAGEVQDAGAEAEAGAAVLVLRQEAVGGEALEIAVGRGAGDAQVGRDLAGGEGQAVVGEEQEDVQRAVGGGVPPAIPLAHSRKSRMGS